MRKEVTLECGACSIHKWEWNGQNLRSNWQLEGSVDDGKKKNSTKARFAGAIGVRTEEKRHYKPMVWILRFYVMYKLEGIWSLWLRACVDRRLMYKLKTPVESLNGCSTECQRHRNQHIAQPSDKIEILSYTLCTNHIQLISPCWTMERGLAEASLLHHLSFALKVLRNML